MHALSAARKTLLLHNYSGNSIRKAKTDKEDAVRIAQYALDRWLDLREYIPDDETRRSLKLLNRQYTTLCKVKTMLNNNFISLVDQSFPGVNKLFSSPQRSSYGHMKWVDFVIKFPHCECVYGIPRSAFKDKYYRWCSKSGYY
ncbi:MAG: IS110 family transposase [Oscillospiraceae bacterium]|nr:IS110 family transposase [Oscillospiraceae bacterium]